MKNHSLMSALVCVVGMGSAVASGLPPERIGFDLVGKVSLGETGATMATAVYKPGWNGTVGVQNANYLAVADEVREVCYRTNDETCLTGTVSLVRSGEGAALTTAYSAVRDLDTECAALALELPVAAFGGGSWRTSNGKSGTFARDWDGKTIGFFNGRIEWLEFAAASGTCFRVAIPGGTSVSVQDDRKWKVNNFTARFFIAGGKRIAKGEARRLSCVISSPNGVALAPDRKTTVKAGPDWILLDYKKDILPGSALDFSNQGLQDAPAGKYGWLRNVGGHFEFERRPGVKQRFYGVNLCFDACFPDRELADRLVTRLVRLGYNTVRIHHFDTVRGLFKNSDLRRGFNPDQIARLDYLLSRCYANGLYVTTDLFTFRTVKWRDIGIDRAGDVPKQVYKNLVALHEPAFEDWCEFSRQLLTHVNPHTGRAYGDEPGLPLISLINEGKLTWCWWEIRKEEPVRRAWESWLAEKRAADPKFAEGRETDPLRIDAADDALLVRFMADVERKLVVRQKEFLRTLGVKAMLTNQNGGSNPAPLFIVGEDLYDYLDIHFYVDHPQFLVKPWTLPSRCGNQNPVGSSYLPYLNVAFGRSPSKPFCITEWNFSGPGMYRGSGGILTGALGALQDWDGLWRFSYSHSIEPLRDDQGAPGYFDAASDPLGQASDRASVCLFLRGDIEPLADAVASRVERTERLPEDGKEPTVPPDWKTAAWQTRVATTLGNATGWKEVSFRETRKSSVAPVPLAANPAVDFDKAHGSFRIVTPKTCGGFTPSGRLSSGAIDFDVGGVAATVWASSLDGRPVSESKRILVTHLTDVQADGNVYANESKTILLKWGRNRSIVRNGEAHVSLALAEPGKYAVWALETTGRRLERIPSRVEGGRLAFTCAVKGPNGARMLYEVVADAALSGAEIQRRIDAAAAKGGGRVVIPAGTHDVGSLRLRSHVELHLERGAVLRGADRSEAYDDFPDAVCSIHPEGSKKVLLYAYDAEDIAVTGEGTIDGQGPRFFDTANPNPWGTYRKPPVQRPRMVQFVRVKGVRLSGVTFKDSPCWTMLVRSCENVDVDGITVTGDQKMINNDGIDFDCCRHVRVRRSRFKTGDDCLIVRAMREAGSDAPAVCEDIVFEDCDLDSWCQTIRLGCPSDDTIRNVRIRNIRAHGRNGIFADYPERYLRPNDTGFMDIGDLEVDGYSGDFSDSALQIVSEPGVKVRSVNGLVFRNLRVRSRNPLRFIGNAGSEIGSVTLENVTADIEKEGSPCIVAGCKGLVYKNVTLNRQRQMDGSVESAPGSVAPLKRTKSVSWESSAN